MKVLAANAKYLRLSGLFWQCQLTTFDKVWQFITNAFFLVNFSAISLGSVFYIRSHPNNIFEWPLLEFFSGLTGFVAYIEILSNAQTVKHIFDELQRIVDNAEKTNAVVGYQNTEQQLRFYTKWVTTIAVAANVTFDFVVFTLAFPTVYMLRGNFDTSTWFVASKENLLFDRTTFFGWYMYSTAVTLLAGSYVFILAVILFYLIGCCMYIETCCQHFQTIFDNVDGAINANDKIRTAHFFHIKIVEIFQLVSSISSVTIFTFLLSNVSLFGGLIYHIDKQLQNEDYTSCIYYMVILLNCSGWTFLLCYATTSATLAVGNIGDIAYNSKWYENSINMREFMVLILTRSQRPVYFTGLKMIRCTLEVFMKLNNTAISYYMMFRSFK